LVLVFLLCGLLSGCSLYTSPPRRRRRSSYHVTAEFDNVLDLGPAISGEGQRLTVGSVEKITLSGWHAQGPDARQRIDQAPADARAELGQTSLLGEKYVALVAPPNEPASAPNLADGASIRSPATGRNPELEEVFSSLSLVLNGGGLPQLQNITTNSAPP